MGECIELIGSTYQVRSRLCNFADILISLHQSLDARCERVRLPLLSARRRCLGRIWLHSGFVTAAGKQAPASADRLLPILAPRQRGLQRTFLLAPFRRCTLVPLPVIR
jgi:hypothetical protein